MYKDSILEKDVKKFDKFFSGLSIAVKLPIVFVVWIISMALISTLFHSCTSSNYAQKSTETYTYEDSCYDLGFKSGSCVARSYKRLLCKPGTDIVIPLRCRHRDDTRMGIKDGINSER